MLKGQPFLVIHMQMLADLLSGRMSFWLIYDHFGLFQLDHQSSSGFQKELVNRLICEESIKVGLNRMGCIVDTLSMCLGSPLEVGNDMIHIE